MILADRNEVTTSLTRRALLVFSTQGDNPKATPQEVSLPSHRLNYFGHRAMPLCDNRAFAVFPGRKTWRLQADKILQQSGIPSPYDSGLFTWCIGGPQKPSGVLVSDGSGCCHVVRSDCWIVELEKSNKRD